MEEIFYRYNPWWEGIYSPEGLIERDQMLSSMKRHLHSRQIVLLTGLRRIGKTTLLKLFIKSLIEKEGISPHRIFYMSLDDYQLSKHKVLELLEEYRRIHKIKFSEKVFLFLDEVVYQKDFEIQLKNIYDSQNAEIYASSSSSSILKSRKSYLTGRNIILEVLPLDFREYLSFKKITISKSDAHLVARYFEDFLREGGIPEYVLKSDVEYLKELVDDIIYKDIAAVYGIKNPQVLKEFFLLLMERAGKTASINKMAKILKISPDTAKRYFEMFSDTYLIYPVMRCGKTNERLLAPKKVYASDLGIRTFFTGFRDKGSLFENYVYLKIRHMKPCYVYDEKLEIDFLTEKKELIEVKYKSEITGKQKTLFDRIKSARKIVIRDILELENFFQQNQLLRVCP
jgi:predicted AAA+ superfamily ATPase